MSVISKRLNQLMAHFGITIKMLSDATAIGMPTIAHLKQGKVCSNPTIGTLLPIAQYFHVSLDQLVGQEPLYLSNQKPGAIRGYPVDLIHKHQVTQFCGAEPKSSEHAVIYLEQDWGAFCFALEQEHDGMARKSYGIFSASIEPCDQDIVIVALPGSKKVYIKRLVDDMNQWYIKDYPQEGEKQQLLSDFRIYGVLVAQKTYYRASAQQAVAKGFNWEQHFPYHLVAANEKS